MAEWKFGDGLIVELKKCPFCGEEEAIDYEFNWGKHGGFVNIRCSACGARSRTVSDKRRRYREELEATWNRRCE